MKKPPARAKPYVPPKKKEQGTFRVDYSTVSQSGQARDHQVIVDQADSATDAINKATSKVPASLIIFKACAVLLIAVSALAFNHWEPAAVAGIVLVLYGVHKRSKK